MSAKLIVALDFDNQNEAFGLIDRIDPKLCILKVGSEVFTHWGPAFITQLVQRDFKVFLDLKFHDIPNTVAKSCAAAAELGVWMINVHAVGGFAMMKAAKEALKSFGQQKPLLIAVTVLTSFSAEDLAQTGVQRQLTEQVNYLSLLAKNAGLDGVVSSGHEVKAIKNQCGADFITVTPGIRLAENVSDDQSRIMTPQMAISEGSDYLVIGRPITKAPDPCAVISQIIKQIS